MSIRLDRMPENHTHTHFGAVHGPHPGPSRHGLRTTPIGPMEVVEGPHLLAPWGRAKIRTHKSQGIVQGSLTQPGEGNDTA